MLTSNGIAPEVLRFDTGWTITYNGKTRSVDNIQNYTFPEPVKNGDSIILSNVVPWNAPHRAVLRLSSHHNAVVVYENDSCLYKYDTEQTRMNFLGGGFHYVYLNPSEKENIKVVYVEQVDGRKVTFSSFYLMPQDYVLSDYVSRHIYALLIGTFLMLFGILVVTISAVTRLYGLSFYRTMMIGILSFTLGIWTLCYTRVIQIMSFNLGVNNSLEYFCLYFSPIPFTFLLWRMHRDNLNRYKNAGFVILLIYEILFTIVTAYLHTKCIVYYPRTLLAFHVSVVVAFLFFIVSGVLYNKKMDAAGKILSQGVIVFGITVLLDLVRFNLNRKFSIEHPLMETTLLPLGTIFFVLFLVRSYVVRLIYILEDRAEKGALATMAYLDALTGLCNRAKSQQIFDILDRQLNDYAIVSIDLNGLKLANDNYGHNAGDKLIKTFARVFKDAFSGIGTAIRMGGDEFLAIVRSEHIADVETALDRLAVYQKKHSIGLPIPLEAAYGIAYRHELAESGADSSENSSVEAEKVYRLADERMYDMKASMKSKLVRK